MLTKLPGTCDTLLPVTLVSDAAGAQLTGRTAFVVGPEDSLIHRIAYLNCRYGIVGTSPPKVEIGVSLYRSAAAAHERIDATVSDYLAHAAHSDDTTVAGLPAQVLTGGVGTDYAGITVVVASGQRTVAVTTRDIATDPTPAQRIAELALAHTGG